MDISSKYLKIHTPHIECNIKNKIQSFISQRGICTRIMEYTSAWLTSAVSNLKEPPITWTHIQHLSAHFSHHFLHLVVRKVLTHWGRATHTCVGKLTIIGSDNGLLPGRRQAIIWTNAGILLIGPLGTNFSEILIEIQTFSLTKIRLKMSSAKCCSFCLGLNVSLRLSDTYRHQ